MHKKIADLWLRVKYSPTTSQLYLQLCYYAKKASLQLVENAEPSL